MHALPVTYLRRGLPGRCHQAHRRWRGADGAQARCIACNNCVLACPFGVPKMHTGMRLMMKCDMCYDRTSVGKKPMCASMCPSQALYFGTRTEIEKLRPNSRPINTFSFGAQLITTKVNMLVPKQVAATHLDVVAALHEPTIGNSLEDDLLLAGMEVTHEP